MSKVIQILPPSQPSDLRAPGHPPYDDGEPPGGDDLRERVAKLEIKAEGIYSRMDSIDARLNRIEDKMLTSWDVAKVQAGIIIFALTLAMLGPRLIALIPVAAQ